ncbi:hypothetical protein acsn021_39720 [Anaerocolumna cellulosilytica]|uniref:Uncharacterized protein n=1 Tax=Anaerocolumna cellulosilytica TaxID=433286 RepID=A0A6S6QYW4_9FIRM|nr:sirohydrochlorin cobaltochelatase [Anaerocolumna cellulosilytica]MBB5196375.1 sirohydrochlorin cobaltochelatase [Anaerocolumna cellulosilytica]BCJ96403.1 hypothetical protein acsn021_39720 [Anaerocolumna cellulosilytica]
MNKKAILVVSFGTSHQDTRERTIDEIEKSMEQAFPSYNIYRAFTSKMIIQILKKRDNLFIPTVTEAMEQMYKAGIEEVIIQPTHILNGIENDCMIEEVKQYLSYFRSVKLGAPLLTETEDYEAVIKGLAAEVDRLNIENTNEDEAVVFMGHGSDHYSNTSYTALQYMLWDFDYRDIYVATVEAYPYLDTIIKHLKGKKYRKITLMPFMIVAGDHARNDMAGEEEDSWKVILEKEGYEVECLLKGLGEYSCIREQLISHAKEAVELKQSLKVKQTVE